MCCCRPGKSAGSTRSIHAERGFRRRAMWPQCACPTLSFLHEGPCPQHLHWKMRDHGSDPGALGFMFASLDLSAEALWAGPRWPRPVPQTRWAPQGLWHRACICSSFGVYFRVGPRAAGSLGTAGGGAGLQCEHQEGGGRVCGPVWAAVQRLCPQASPAPRPDSLPFWLVRDKSGWAASALPGWPSVSAAQRKGVGGSEVGEFRRQDGVLGSQGTQLPWDSSLGVACECSSGSDKLAAGLCKGLDRACKGPVSPPPRPVTVGEGGGVAGRCLQPSDSKECNKHSPSIHLEVAPNPGRLPPGTKDSCQT